MHSCKTKSSSTILATLQSISINSWWDLKTSKECKPDWIVVYHFHRWITLLCPYPEYSVACSILEQFYKPIQNIFELPNKNVLTDNRKGYFSHNFIQYLGENGMHHQSSCAYTLQQRFFCSLDVFPELLLQKAILASVIPINTLLLKTIQVRTPLRPLLKKFPQRDISNSFPFKEFESKSLSTPISESKETWSKCYQLCL